MRNQRKYQAEQNEDRRQDREDEEGNDEERGGHLRRSKVKERHEGTDTGNEEDDRIQTSKQEIQL